MDLCFVGGGLACLYGAFMALKRNPGLKVIVLEKGARLGGRAHNVKFHGVEVPEGAGIGRFRKDRLLRALMKELGLETKTFVSQNQAIGFKKVEDVMAIVERLKAAAGRYDRGRCTFGEFARAELGGSLYRRFVASVGYSDFEKADIIDTLYHYGFDDVVSGDGVKCFVVPWNKVVRRLVARIQEMGAKIVLGVDVKAVVSGSEVSGMRQDGSELVVKCKRVVVGVGISGLRRLFRGVDVYKHIESQCFIRVYGLLGGRGVERFKEKINMTTLVKNELQKIIPMGGDVFMIGYADNARALSVLEKCDDLNALSKLVEEASGVKGVVVKDVHVKYWAEGTHYYLPLAAGFKSRRAFVRAAQHPLGNGVLVIGEVVSLRYQGWTEGALESVDKGMFRAWS